MIRDFCLTQGECSKAEVERAAAARRSEIAERRLSSVEIECRAAKEKATSLESREREARLKAQAASAELVKVSRRRKRGIGAFGFSVWVYDAGRHGGRRTKRHVAKFSPASREHDGL